ncbi:MAG: hypothetical protein H6553_10265 [Chitinophagales bacterium]|nr:hypothetical protein [Chitinophagales bacterium]
MKKTILLTLTVISFTFSTFAQETSNETTNKKFEKVLKGNIGFTYHSYDQFNLSPEIGFLLINQKQNVHEFGLSYNSAINTRRELSANEFMLNYGYRIVFLKNKATNIKPFISFIAGIGASHSNNNLALYNINYKVVNNLFTIQAGIAPGFQYTKNKFFLDFSVPFKASYMRETSKIKDSNYSYKNKFNDGAFNVGAKIGLGVKF